MIEASATTGAARRAALLEAARATRGRWRLVALSAVLGAGAVVAAGALLAVSGFLISRASQRPEILLLGVAIVGVRFFGITRALLRYVERLVSHDLAFRALTDLRVRFFRRLVPLVPGGLPSGPDLLARFVGDADRLQDLYLRALLPPLIAVVAGLAGILAAALILPEAGLVVLGVLLLGGVAVPVLTRAIARRSGRRQASARSALGARMVEVVDGGAEIAIAGREPEWERRVDAASSTLGRLLRRDALAGGVAIGSAATIAAGAVVAMAAVAIPAVGDGRLAGVLLAALVLLAMGSVEAIAPLPAAGASIDAVGDAAARLEAITDVPAPVSPAERPAPLPAAGALGLEGVGFSYEDGAPVLDRLDLRLEAGAAVALVGPSGAGKSTLADLLVRFRDPTAGRITLGGVDLRELDPDRLRDAVRLVPQDAYLFATTVRANVAIGRSDATEAEIAAALDRVGLGPWIETLPNGIDTYVGESGAQVSGGQRQRIAAARGVVSSARFLIFDEPSTHLDPDGAAELLAALAGLAHGEGRAVLVITHERGRLERFDAVVELSAGQASS